MKIDDLKNFSKNIDGKILFNFNIKKFNWLNIGGEVKVFFKPDNLKELKEFLKLYGRRGKIFILGAGSNVLFKDDTYQGVVIKLGNNFSNITTLNNNTIIAGSSCAQKKLSEFAKNNNLGGLEFMSCIPGTIGGGIKMNSGCFGNEFKDFLVSLQIIDFDGNIKSIPANRVIFKYRETDLPKDIIFLSGTFRTQEKNKIKIEKLMSDLKIKKETAQPTKIKTGGSTFKNPKEETNKKVWELIKATIPKKTNFGDASISEKHANFFVNKNNANYSDMKSLIDFVKEKVKIKTGIELNLEIVIVD